MFLFRRSPWTALFAACSGIGCLVAFGVGLMAYLTVKTAMKSMKEFTAQMSAAHTDLTVRNDKLLKDHGNRYIVGKCVNRSKTQAYVPVEVTFSLYDANGLPTGVATAHTMEPLKPGSSWKFKAPIENEAARTYASHGAVGYPVSQELEKALNTQGSSRTELLLKNMSEFLGKEAQDPQLRKALEDSVKSAAPTP